MRAAAAELVTCGNGDGYPGNMQTGPNANEPYKLVMVSPKDAVAVARSRPTPTDGHLVASGLTDEEWDAFIEALTED